MSRTENEDIEKRHKQYVKLDACRFTEGTYRSKGRDRIRKRNVRYPFLLFENFECSHKLRNRTQETIVRYNYHP